MTGGCLCHILPKRRTMQAPCTSGTKAVQEERITTQAAAPLAWSGSLPNPRSGKHEKACWLNMPMVLVVVLARPTDSELRLDQVHDVAHVLQRRGLLVGQLHVKALLQGHHGLHDVQAVRAQLCERGLAGDLFLVHAELLRDD